MASKKKSSGKAKSAEPGLITIGSKRAIETLVEYIEHQKRKPPRLRLMAEHPVSDFVLEMRTELGRWPENHLRQFIVDVTGENPEVLGITELLAIARKIFHEMFNNEEGDRINLKDPASVWKMWPFTRSNAIDPKQRQEVSMETQTEGKTSKRSKFSSSATAEAPKKASKKAAAEAPAAASKKASKKQEAAPAKGKAKGKEKPEGESTRLRLSEDTKISFVKDPTKKGARQELADAAKLKSTKTVGHLIERMKSAEWDESTTRNYMNKLIRGGCIKVL